MGALGLPDSRKLAESWTSMNDFEGLVCGGEAGCHRSGAVAARHTAAAASTSQIRRLRAIAEARSRWRRRVKAAALFGCQTEGGSSFARRSSTQELFTEELSLCSISLDVLLAERLLRPAEKSADRRRVDLHRVGDLLVTEAAASQQQQACLLRIER